MPTRSLSAKLRKPMSTLIVQSIPDWQPEAIELPDSMRITPAQFAEICARNTDLSVELSHQGDLIIRAPTGGTSGWRNSEISTALAIWVRQVGKGRAFDSSTVFHIPNGAMRGLDAAWVRSERWDVLTDSERDGFPPLCPDFVIELRSMTDRLKPLQAKMEEHLANGASLGFLIDPTEQTVHVYRAQSAPEILDQPDSISGDPELPGLSIQLSKLW